MKKVLIVEDDPVSLWAIKNKVQQDHRDWLVFEAKTVESARRQIQQNQFDAIITDWVFDKEVECGRDVLKIAKEKDPFTMVIVVSAYEDRFDRYQDAFKLGAYDVIPKSHPRKTACKEIILKTEVALQLRQLHRQSLSLSRHIDSKISALFETAPEKLRFQKKLLTISFCDLRGFSAL